MGRCIAFLYEWVAFGDENKIAIFLLTLSTWSGVAHFLYLVFYPSGQYFM